MSEEKQRKQAEACEAETPKDAGGAADTGRNEKGAAADAKAAAGSELDAVKTELDAVKAQLEEKAGQCADYLDKLQRTAAEFDNYKKRSAKEKEALYIDATGDVVGAFIPVMDNLERAMQAMTPDSTVQTLKDGVEMVAKQFHEAFKTVGVEEIKAVNETFDPMKHNAVMHVEDDTVGPNTVVEELQKGYVYKERVIRYSMVKVAN